MKLSASILITAGLLLGWLPAAKAQLGPIQLKVAEETKTERNTNYSYRYAYSNYKSRTSTQFTYLNVELFNTSGKTAHNITAKWCLFVQPPGKRLPETITGEVTTDIAFGHRYKFETDGVQTDQRTRRTYAGYYGGGSSTSSSGGKADLLGYYVEVYEGDKLIASQKEPANIKDQIAQAKRDAEAARNRPANPQPQEPAPEPPKRHRFY